MRLVLDFAGLERIGSQPIISTAMNGVYAQVRRWANQSGCQVRLCGVSGALRGTYQISSLHLLFPEIHESRAEAIEALQ